MFDVDRPAGDRASFAEIFEVSVLLFVEHVEVVDFELRCLVVSFAGSWKGW